MASPTVAQMKRGLRRTVSRNQVNSPCSRECSHRLNFGIPRVAGLHDQPLEGVLGLGLRSEGQRFCNGGGCSEVEEAEGINSGFPQSPLDVCAVPHPLGQCTETYCIE